MSALKFKWLVIGAGPAGIAALGQLLDHGVAAQEICWIDAHFKVGDLGAHWQYVSSNTKVELFIKFLNSCDSFEYQTIAQDFALHQANPEDTCLLSLVVQPLQAITTLLQNKVAHINTQVEHIKKHAEGWDVFCSQGRLLVDKIILATGAEPLLNRYPPLTDIPLQIALHPQQLMSVCEAEDVIAVFGSSHSAVLIIQTLIEMCDVKKVINFYRSPLRYAVYYDDWILFDDTGLKGKAADWAKKHLEDTLPSKLERIFSNDENVSRILPQCSKTIHAIGFQKRFLSIEGVGKKLHHNAHGEIAPGLFGIGIGFPEPKMDRFGTLEYRVGLYKFMNYLITIMPIWLSLSGKH